jgi:hypothetical protein
MDVLSTIAHSSSTLIGWSITILGGTFLAILSSSFNRPSSLKFRLTYFLFIPGWTCLFWSIKKGDDITGRVIAARIAEVKFPERSFEIMSEINADLICQRDLFLFSLIFLALWLLSYLFWWIFSYNVEKED